MAKSPRQMKRDSDDIRRVQDAICRRVASGEALPSICRDETLPDVATVFEWLADGRRAAFRDRLRHAQAVRRDMLAEQILDIADGVAGGDDGTDPEKSSSLDRDQLQLAKVVIGVGTAITGLLWFLWVNFGQWIIRR
ncbi:MAG: hypothetical protein AAGF58_04795 [Pseudomonadota bacterium]